MRQTTFLVRAEVYPRIKGRLYDSGDWTEADLRGALARSAAASGWNEPSMEDYDR